MNNDKYKVNGTQAHKKRTPLHKQNPLSAFKKEGKERYWMVEYPGRRDKFELAGWTAVNKNENASTCDKDIVGGKHIGSEERQTVNKDSQATAHTAVLMEIDKNLYDQDYAEQQDLINQKEEGIDPAKNKGFQKSTYGSLEKGLE